MTVERRPLAADLGDPPQVKEVAARALRTLGSIDVLVNTRSGIFLQLKAKGPGSIVNITSIVASVGIGRFPQAAYSASKGAPRNHSRVGLAMVPLWHPGEQPGPGFIQTEMTKTVIEQNVRQWILHNTLLPRYGLP